MALTLRHSAIRIQTEKVWLDAYLCIAPDVRGLIVYAAPHLAKMREAREAHFCSVLENAGFGTLIVSMLTPYEEQRDPDCRYDIALISRRLESIGEWIVHQPQLYPMRLGLVACDTIAAAAIRLANRNTELLTAMVSKAGRIDLAGAHPLEQLRTPIMVLMPGAEPSLLPPTQSAYALIRAPKTYVPIEHASSAFVEPGCLDAAAQSCRQWFEDQMPVLHPETS